jgi:type I restriction enzyme S subunit
MSWDTAEVPIAATQYFETLNGLWTGKKKPFVEAGVIRNTNFTPSGAIDYSNIAYLEVEAKQLSKRRLEAGDIILERSGGGPKQPVGRVVFFDREDGDFSFSNFTSAIRVKDKTKFDSKFVFYGLMELYQSGKTEDIQRRTTGIRNLDFTAYKERARFPVIPLAEQKKIAKILSTVQRAIEEQERIIQTTTDLKKALMQKLFTEGLSRDGGKPQKQTEIGPIPESWEVVPLGSLAKVGNGSTPKRAKEGYWEGGTIPWLNSTKIHDRFITEADQFVTPLAVKECHLPKVATNSLLIAITGQGKTLGNSAITRIETCINQHLAYAQFHSLKIVPDFVLWFMQTRYDYLRSIAHGGGSTKGALTCGFLKTLPIPVPSLAEQEEITETFQALENKKVFAARKHAVLQNLFRTLLHELMTAKTRVDIP